MNAQLQAAEAQAILHHQLLLGLQLAVAVNDGPQAIGDWMFRLFRRQHHEKFLSSFDKLGLTGLPHAVACARYHVVSNSIGGVPVEYAEEGPRKAWVRFRYPRWMFDGPAICGIPIEASRGFLRGWYAHNGVSLNNPRLGFVCVSEDMSGQYGFCGYFREYDRDLGDDERLQFKPDERPPPFDAAAQPAPPTATWSADRLAKARRNYALDYIRNGLPTLIAAIGADAGRARIMRAAELTGLQAYARLAGHIGARDGGPVDAAHFLATMFRGMGDDADVTVADTGARAVVRHSGLRALDGLPRDDRALMLETWTALWRGTIKSHRAFMRLDVAPRDTDLIWTITAEGLQT